MYIVPDDGTSFLATHTTCLEPMDLSSIDTNMVDRAHLKKIERVNPKIDNSFHRVKHTFRRVGRIIPGKDALVYWNKSLRGRIAKGYTTIDIKNAHPTILQQVVAQQGISIPFLTEYVNNRGDILNRVSAIATCSLEESKQIMIKVLTGWKPLNVLLKDSFIRGFREDRRRIRKLLCRYNPGVNSHSVIGMYCQHMERLCMNIIIESLVSMHIIPCNGDEIECVMCYDGVMVPNPVSEYDIHTLEKNIHTGLGINIELIQS